MRKGKGGLDVVGKKSLILSTLLTSLLIISIYLGNIGGCGGGGNEPMPPEIQEFTLYVSLWQIELSDGVGTACPKPVSDLVLKLTTTGDEVFGEANLMNTIMLGPIINIGGVVEDGLIVIDPFSVNVDWIPRTGSQISEPSAISFSFDSFVGNLFPADNEITTDRMDVIASGHVSEIGEGDVIICDGDFTMERVADGCVPSSFFPHSDCLAKSISQACNFVTGCFVEVEGLHGDFWIGCGGQADCTCEVIDCNSLICPLGPVTNLQYDPIYALVGNEGFPDNPGLQFTCNTGFAPF
jgi:hypothetical protein